MRAIFFTGFPGFLGSELLPRVLSRDPEVQAICLVQAKYAALARSRAEQITATHPHLQGRIEFVEGDITQTDLGLGAAENLKRAIVEIYHLAAIYDLSVPREPALRINVEGTRHMLCLAEACPGLRRFQYISTCYVSGRHPGVFREDDLECGQRFNNFYEETKYLAEMEVQHQMRQGLPATIYRPAVVVGDSTTGETQKYDGPYSVVRLLLRQPRIAVLPVIGDPAATEVNVVPRDFVVDALAYLSGQPESAGQVYQLADPSPLTVEQMSAELAKAAGRTIIRVPLPIGLAKYMVSRVPFVGRLMGVPAAALDYFVHPTRYDTARAQAALRGSGIRCPRFPEYAARIVSFVRKHPEISSAAMV